MRACIYSRMVTSGHVTKAVVTPFDPLYPELELLSLVGVTAEVLRAIIDRKSAF